jgi:hypothetical protein
MLITNNEPRISISAFVSIPDEHLSRVTEIIGRALTVIYGGLSVSEAVGFWSSKGNEYLEEYPADELSISTLHIRLTVMPHELQKAIRDIEQVLKETKKGLNLPARFVHVEAIESKVFHLDIADMDK